MAASSWRAASHPPDIVRLPVPEGLACAVLHPHLAVQTGAARALLGDTVPLKDAVRQWANLGALVAALFTGDLALLSRSLVDVVAEPKRAALVPGFYAVKAAAIGGRRARLQPVGIGAVDVRAGQLDWRWRSEAGEAMQRAFSQATAVSAATSSCRRSGARARAW